MSLIDIPSFREGKEYMIPDDRGQNGAGTHAPSNKDVTAKKGTQTGMTTGLIKLTASNHYAVAG
jgi:hypothetical protein